MAINIQPLVVNVSRGDVSDPVQLICIANSVYTYLSL